MRSATFRSANDSTARSARPIAHTPSPIRARAATAACEIEKGLLSHQVPLTLNHFGDDPVQRITHDHQRLKSVSERQEIAKAISTSDSTRYGECSFRDAGHERSGGEARLLPVSLLSSVANRGGVPHQRPRTPRFATFQRGCQPSFSGLSVWRDKLRAGRNIMAVIVGRGKCPLGTDEVNPGGSRLRF